MLLNGAKGRGHLQVVPCASDFGGVQTAIVRDERRFKKQCLIRPSQQLPAKLLSAKDLTRSEFCRVQLLSVALLMVD